MSKQCPVCNSNLSVSQPIEINQLVHCSNCGLELEVIWLYPLEFARVSGMNSGERLDKSKLKKRIKGMGSSFPAVE